MQTQISSRSPFSGYFYLVFTVCVALVYPGTAAQSQSETSAVGPFRTQTIQFDAGWNAVYFEIEPLVSDPTALFVDTPIEIVAAYFRPVTSMEFVDSPTDVLVDRKRWNVWYAPERDDALLSDLYAIQAHRAYLVYSDSDYTFELEGVPFSGSAQWYPNAYSLVGFPIHLLEQPTLANFFAGSKAHDPLQLYRMVAGKWTLVTNPESTYMQAGEAYWVYSDGATTFPGPLRVEFDGQAAGGLVFSDASEPKQIVFTNESSFPLELSLSMEPGTAGLLPMVYLVDALDGPNEPIETISLPLPEVLEIGPLEAGASFALVLDVVEANVEKPLVGANLVITTDAGLRHDVPIISFRRDLIQP